MTSCTGTTSASGYTTYGDAHKLTVSQQVNHNPLNTLSTQSSWTSPLPPSAFLQPLSGPMAGSAVAPQPIGYYNENSGGYTTTKRKDCGPIGYNKAVMGQASAAGQLASGSPYSTNHTVLGESMVHNPNINQGLAGNTWHSQTAMSTPWVFSDTSMFGSTTIITPQLDVGAFNYQPSEAAPQTAPSSVDISTAACTCNTGVVNHQVTQASGVAAPYYPVGSRLAKWCNPPGGRCAGCAARRAAGLV